MYELIEAPDMSLSCRGNGQNWVLGLLRSTTFQRSPNWEQFAPAMPLVIPETKVGCFIQYHRLFADSRGTYLEYWAGDNSGWMHILQLVPGAGSLPIVATKAVGPAPPGPSPPSPPPPPQPPPGPTPGPASDNLVQGAQLTAGASGKDRLRSSNGQYELVCETSGNVALYDRDAGSKMLWQTNTKGPSGKYHLNMQTDGNLVLYNDAQAEPVVWNTDTAGSSGRYHLVMQADGNLVLYDDPGRVVWATNTHGNSFRAIVEN